MEELEMEFKEQTFLPEERTEVIMYVANVLGISFEECFKKYKINLREEDLDELMLTDPQRGTHIIDRVLHIKEGGVKYYSLVSALKMLMEQLTVCSYDFLFCDEVLLCKEDIPILIDLKNHLEYERPQGCRLPGMWFSLHLFNKSNIHEILKDKSNACSNKERALESLKKGQEYMIGLNKNNQNFQTPESPLGTIQLTNEYENNIIQELRPHFFFPKLLFNMRNTSRIVKE